MGELCCLEFYVFKPGSRARARVLVQLFGRHKPKKKRDRSFLYIDPVRARECFSVSVVPGIGEQQR